MVSSSRSDEMLLASILEITISNLSSCWICGFWQLFTIELTFFKRDSNKNIHVIYVYAMYEETSNYYSEDLFIG